MAIEFIQGFEHLLPTTEAQISVSPTELRDFLGFDLPVNQTDWFMDSTGGFTNLSGLMVINSDVRIDGQSLRIRRPNSGSFNSNFNGLSAVDFTKSLALASRVVVGFAVKYSKAPEQPIPLLQWRYDDATNDFEQASLWVGKSGVMFFATTDMNLASTSPIAAVPIDGALTPRGTFNFTEWQYIEVDYSLGATGLPSVIVYVNGVVVLSFTGTALRKTASPFASTVSIISPQNGYFLSNSYTMFLDDYYLSTAEPALGPQHIVLLQPTSTVQNQFVITGGVATSYEAVDGLFNESDLTNFISNDSTADVEIFGLADVPATIDNVTAVSYGIIGEVNTGLSRYQLEMINGANTRSEDISETSTTPRYRWGIFEVQPNNTPWTVAALNSTNLAIDIVS